MALFSPKKELETQTRTGGMTTQLQIQIAFINKVRKIMNSIHSAPNMDALLLELKEELLSLFEAERLTMYALTEDGAEVYSKVKAGDEIKEFRVPIDNSSIAGYVAKNQKVLLIQDAYNIKELQAIDLNLRFNRDYDMRSGFRTKQVLAVPILMKNKVLGVLQLINKKNGDNFSPEDKQATMEIAETLAIAFHNHQKNRGQQLSKYDLLIAENLLMPVEIETALELAKSSGQTVETILMQKYKILKPDIGRALQAFYHLPIFEFKAGLPVPEEFSGKLEPSYLRKQLWVPLRREEDTVFVALDNPRALDKIDDIKRHIPARNYRLMVGMAEDILKAIDYFWGAQAKEESKGKKDKDTVSMLLDDIATESQAPREEELAEDVSESDSAVIRLVNRMIIDANEQGVSDIHIEPYGAGQQTIVRFRVDGACREYQKFPSQVRRAIISRIKVMANMDISNRRIPQDGKIQFKKFSNLDIELRVATIPTSADNEDAVLRILAAHKPIPLDGVGLSPNNLDQFKRLVKFPYGIILVVGPTGSGKTTTLHSALGFLNTPEKKIWTAEDPVEITQYGLRQVQVNPKAGFTFAIAMRAFLRANPDIIMIGEMRDFETASIAIEASLTGHLVLSTLHTNSAPETIIRLLDMGIDPFNFADALLGVLAQRLSRTLCKECRKPVTPTPELFQEIVEEYGDAAGFQRHNISYGPELKLYQAQGCNACRLGYKGRMGIHELLACSEHIKTLIHKKKTAEEIRDAAVREGMVTLKQDGILKVLQGRTDLAQIRAVCIK